MSINELIDILDQKGQRIGTLPRHEAEMHNHLTENVLIFVSNSEGRLWTQKRALTKKHFPGVWDISACGSVEAGETRNKAAARETFEEMGFKLQLKYQESFLNIFPGEDGVMRKRMSHLYTGNTDQTPVTNHEVSDVRLWDPNELRARAVNFPDEFVSSFVFELDKASVYFQ